MSLEWQIKTVGEWEIHYTHGRKGRMPLVLRHVPCEDGVCIPDVPYKTEDGTFFNECCDCQVPLTNQVLETIEELRRECS